MNSFYNYSVQTNIFALKSKNPMSLKLFNVSGRLLYKKKDTTYDNLELNQGIYFLSLNDGLFVHKLIVR